MCLSQNGKFTSFLPSLPPSLPTSHLLQEENGNGPYFVGDSLTIADLQVRRQEGREGGKKQGREGWNQILSSFISPVSLPLPPSLPPFLGLQHLLLALVGGARRRASHHSRCLSSSPGHDGGSGEPGEDQELE